MNIKDPNYYLPYILEQCFSMAATHDAHVIPRTSNVQRDNSSICTVKVPCEMKNKFICLEFRLQLRNVDNDAKDRQYLKVFGMRCWRRIERIRWTG